MTDPVRLGHLLHGRHPRRGDQLAEIAVGLAGAAAAWTVAPPGLAGILVALFAFDWTGGLVANAAASTRAYWAELPIGWPIGFVALHLAELPLLFWLTGGEPPFGLLAAILIAKLAIFVTGQAALRAGAGRPNLREEPHP